MNISNLHLQRKYLLISAASGLFSILLPWITLSVEVFRTTTNGLHSYGIVVFLAFLGAVLLILKGNGSQPLDKARWMAVLLCGIIALVFTLIYMNDESGPSFEDVSFGLGVKIALIASSCVIAFSLFLKTQDDNFKSGFTSLKNQITSIIPPTAQTLSHKLGNLDDLEKLIRYKEEGKITEEEFQRLKSKII